MGRSLKFYAVTTAFLLASVDIVHAQGKPLPVTVTNQPTVNLAPGSSVSVSGTPTIQGSVTVNNSTSSPVISRGLVLPFQSFTTVTFPEGGQNTSADAIAEITVPDGVRLAIEHVSARSCLPAGQRILATIITRAGGTQLGHSLPMTLQGTFPFTDNSGNPLALDCFVGSEATSLYADAGNSVFASAQRTNGDSNPNTPGRASISLSVSGRLIPIDAAQ